MKERNPALPFLLLIGGKICKMYAKWVGTLGWYTDNTKHSLKQYIPATTSVLIICQSYTLPLISFRKKSTTCVIYHSVTVKYMHLLIVFYVPAAVNPHCK